MTGLTKRCCIVFLAALLTLCAFWAHGASADDSYYYAGGQRHSLPASANWLAVQLDKGGQADDVSAAVKAHGALDTGRAVRKLGRFNIALVPLQNTSSDAARSTVRSSTAAVPGVKRVLRTFGSGKNPIIETDEFVVQFKPGTSKEQAAAILAKRGAALVEQLGPYVPNGYRARVLSNAVTAASVANELFESGLTVFAHPNFIWPKQKRFIPNDPLFSQQWYLRNVGQTGGTTGADISVEQAWNISRGSSSIKIAVLDDGFDLTHEDLAANFLPGRDFVGSTDADDPDSDPSPGPGDGHGTSCAGLVAGVGNNGKGISGVAPLCKIIPVRIVGFVTEQDEADAFRFAADQGADIISNSWGPQDGLGIEQPLPDIVKAGIDYAATSGRGGKGCVIFWAAGNGTESADLDGYASYSKVISVAASINDGSHAVYSDFGSSVDLNAPGGEGDIVVTDNHDVVDDPNVTGDENLSGYGPGLYFNNFSGTSASAPLAAGVAALVLSVDPSLTNIQVQDLLQNTADKNGPSGTYDSNGHSNLYGFGRVNALHALQGLGKYSVSGRITNASNVGVAGVTVTSSTGVSTTTDSSGNYTLPKAGTGATVITPSLANTVFTPASQSLTLTADVTGINFSALSYIVSLITPADGATVSRTIGLVGRTNGNDAGTSRMDFEYRTAPFTQTLTPGLAIPDAPANQGDPQTSAISSFTLDHAGLVQAATVSVDITHQFVTDLVVTLIAPDGQQFVLHQNAFNGSGTSQNLKQTYILPLGSTLPPLAGTWQLKIEDTVQVDTGVLNSWSMSFDPKWAVAASDTDGASAGDWTASWNVLPLPAGAYQARARGFFGGTGFESATNSIAIAPGYKISGRVTTGGAGAANVALTRTGSAAQVTTDSDGNYAFEGLAPGTYTVTPVPAGAVSAYTPVSKSVTISTTDVANVNFAAVVANLNISGRVTSGGAGIPNVTVSRSGAAASVKTDASGNFTFSAVPPGTYTITPNATGVFTSFTPVSKSVTLTTADAINVNFFAPAALTITGRITAGGAGIPGVGVARSGSTAIVKTDASGNYTLTGLVPGTYTITAQPTGAFTAFTPVSKSVTLTTVDAINVNFFGSAALKITGHITSGGAGIPGVGVSRSGSTAVVKTDSSGTFTMTGVIPGTYTITPNPTGPFTAFTPVSKSVTVTTADAVNVNFTAPAVLKISGRITAGGAGIPGVVVNRTGTTGTVKTDANGDYTINGLAPGTYTITPHPIGSFAAFTPVSKSVTLAATDGVNVNFTAAAALKITGRITAGGAGIPGVGVARSGSTGIVKTDASGNYTIAGLVPGTYTITAQPTGAFTAFTPVSKSVTLTTVDAANVNFFGSAALKITGRITAGGAGIPGVGVARSGSTGIVKTDSSGNYTLTGLVPGTYTITAQPTGAFTAFTPVSKSVTLTTVDAANINFFGSAVLKIAGRITSGGVGVSSISVSRSGSTGVVKTDSSGNYTMTGLVPGTYTITPQPTGVYTSYTPASKDVTLATVDGANVNFVGVVGSAPIATTSTTRSSGAQLSSASAASDGVMVLSFTHTLAASDANPDLYSTTAGIESAAVKNNTLTLTVPDGSWHSGDKVTIVWHDLKDWQNAVIADGSVTTTVK